MACKYYIKGQLIGNELLLADFLLEKERFRKTLGDLVFSKTAAHLKSLDIVDIIKKRSELYTAERVVLYDESGERMVEFENTKFLDVTRFFAGYKHDGRLLVPEFRKDPYWWGQEATETSTGTEGRFQNWKRGEFTPEEKALFFTEGLSVDEIKDPEVEKKIQDKINTMLKANELTKEKATEFVKRMTYLWWVLGKIGTEVHKVFQMFFSNKLKFDDVDPKWMNKALFDLTVEYAKQIKKYIVDTYGDGVEENVSIFPEMKVICNDVVIPDVGTRGLVGTLDLLVIDKHGHGHILDYKTSTKDYGDKKNSTAKTRAYTYLLGLYGRMLNQYGFSLSNITYEIIPIKIDGLKVKYENDHEVMEIDPSDAKTNGWADAKRPVYMYSGLVPYKPDPNDKESRGFVNIKNEVTSQTYGNNLNLILPERIPLLDITSQDATVLVNDTMSKWFKRSGKSSLVSDAEIAEEVAKIKPDTRGMLIYKTKGGSPISEKATNDRAKDEAKLFKSIKNYYLNIENSRSNHFARVKDYLRIGIGTDSKETDYVADSTIFDLEMGSKNWVTDTFSLYFRNKDHYQIVSNDLMDVFQVIGLYNKLTLKLEIFKISTSELKRQVHFDSKGELLTAGLGIDDSVYLLDKKSLMLKATFGNVEAIETMLLMDTMADSLKTLGVKGIESINVINPIHQYGLTATNQELKYSYDLLVKHSPISYDYIGSNDVHFSSNYEKMVSKYTELMSGSTLPSKLERVLHGFENHLSELENKDTLFKINRLTEMLEELLHASNLAVFDSNATSVDSQQKDVVMLYNTILMTIAELKGINFKQELRRYSKLLDSISLTDGISGMYTDNPGNLRSENLNIITELVLSANLNVKEDVLRNYNELLKHVTKLKESKDFGYFSSRFRNNGLLYVTLLKGEDSLIHYNGMMYRDASGNMMIANPWVNDEHSRNLNEALKEFLKYFLERINAMRYDHLTKELRDQMRDSGNSLYFEAALVLKANKPVNVMGLLKGTADVLKMFIHPIKTAKAALDGFNNVTLRINNAEGETDSYMDDRLGSFYKLNNEFLMQTSDVDSGANSLRNDLLKNDDSYFEDNLETVLLKAEVSYASSKNINLVFPLIKATILHLIQQGTSQNTVYKDEIQYLNDYVKAKIKNESLSSGKAKEAEKALSNLRSAASFCMLAFAPVLYFYQLVDGFWKGIQLLVRGDAGFKRKDLMEAAKIALKEMAHYSDKHSLVEQLNMYYGLNDMDSNTYADKIKSDQSTFMSLAYRCASRPDFYNRLTLLIAQMKADGCWEAHSLNSDGELIYDWTKDTRYDVFAKYAKNPSLVPPSLLTKFNELKGRYIAVMNQMISEGTKDAKGNNLILDINNPVAIPKAYTNQEMMSIKSLGDTLYGYYSHETKSMILSLTIGALWMQYRTYWSGKKNLYLAHGGVKLKGKYVIQEGVWEDIDPETGRITLTDKDTGVPHYVWKGEWLEGIFVSMANLFAQGHLEGYLKAWHNLLNEDTEINKIRRANFRLLSYDLIMAMLVGTLVSMLLGDWLDEEKKEARETGSFIAASKAQGVLLLSRILGNSFLDLNFFDSIGGPLTDWTPVSIAWAGRQASALGNTIFGDEHFTDLMQSAFGVAKQHSITLNFIDDLLHSS